MRHSLFVVLLVFYSVIGLGQQPTSKCHPDAYALSLRIIGDVFDNDIVAKNASDTAKAFIRIHVQPEWNVDDSFYLIRLVGEKDPPDRASVAVKYSLPKGSQTIKNVVEKLLKNEPCLSTSQLTNRLHLTRSETSLSSESAKLANQVFETRFTPKPLDHNSVRLDATLYTVEIVGDSRFRIISDDHESEIVKWAQELLYTIEAVH